MDKKIISVGYIGYIRDQNICIDKFITKLNDIKEKYSKDFINLNLILNEDIDICGQRYETDEEYYARKAAEQAIIDKKTQQEYKKYLELKAKFEE